MTVNAGRQELTSVFGESQTREERIRRVLDKTERELETRNDGTCVLKTQTWFCFQLFTPDGFIPEDQTGLFFLIGALREAFMALPNRFFETSRSAT